MVTTVSFVTATRQCRSPHTVVVNRVDLRCNRIDLPAFGSFAQFSFWKPKIPTARRTAGCASLGIGACRRRATRPDGLRFAIIYTRLHDLLRPLLAADQPSAPPIAKSIAHHRHPHHRTDQPHQITAEPSLRTSPSLSGQASLAIKLRYAGTECPATQTST